MSTFLLFYAKWGIHDSVFGTFVEDFSDSKQIVMNKIS